MTQTKVDSQIWFPGPISPKLATGSVDIWKIALNLSASTLEQIEAWLSEEEHQRASRFRFQAHQIQFIAAHGCLREILARYLNINPKELQFIASSQGKPSLADDFRSTGLTFNLSHSNEWGLVAVAYQRAVGIDIEFIRDGLADEQITRRFFSEHEVADLLSLPIELRRLAFFNCWTRKEAYIKARGEGLSMPLNAFDVAILPGEPVEIIRTRPDPAQALQWKLYALQPDDGYVAALSVEGQPDLLNCWQWSDPTCN